MYFQIQLYFQVTLLLHPQIMLVTQSSHAICFPAQSAWAVDYIDYISAEGLDPTTNECAGYDIKQSDGEGLIMLELWGIQSTHSLSSLPGQQCPGVVATNRVISICQIDPF